MLGSQRDGDGDRELLKTLNRTDIWTETDFLELLLELEDNFKFKHVCLFHHGFSLRVLTELTNVSTEVRDKS